MWSRAAAAVKPEGERDKEKLVQTTEREKQKQFQHQMDLSSTPEIDDLVEKKGNRLSVVWKYFGYSKNDTEQTEPILYNMPAVDKN